MKRIKRIILKIQLFYLKNRVKKLNRQILIYKDKLSRFGIPYQDLKNLYKSQNLTP